ncbi:MAG: hypothetical protein ABSC48_16790 [Terracidiphilus sp.]|jgi:hypothetical protein
MSTESEARTAGDETAREQPPPEEERESNTLRVIGWLSVGVAVAAIGIFVGRELRSRYKFNHRDPYDFYAHAGEEQTGEFGMGV